MKRIQVMVEPWQKEMLSEFANTFGMSQYIRQCMNHFVLSGLKKVSDESLIDLDFKARNAYEKKKRG
jgi:hypothetical protein